jgi:death-on-curing protein
VIWIDSLMASAIHELALLEGGGAEGLRDPGLLESALARPLQLLAYAKPKPTIPGLAAAYAWGLIRDHPFVDGNKRTALLVADAFCTANGYRFEVSEEECVIIFEAAASGEIQEAGLAAWFKRHTRRKGSADG